jgi:hypothetical protein
MARTAARARLVAAVVTVGMAAAVPSMAGVATAAERGPAHLLVDDDGRQCPRASFRSIQRAVDAAPAGATVRVCAGTYPEQVTLGPAKRGVQLLAVHGHAAVVKAPASLGGRGAVVHVDGARDVVIAGFTIAGPLPDVTECPDAPRSGVRIGGAGSATVKGNVFDEIRDPTPVDVGCPDGIAVLVGWAGQGDVGSALVAGNTLRRYQEAGITVSNAGSRGHVVENRLAGVGPIAETAQVGVWVSQGAVATVARNDVRDHQTLNECCVAPGVWLDAAAAGTEVIGNVLSANDNALAVITTTGARVARNLITRSTGFDGIFVSDDSTGNAFVGNVLRDNVEVDCRDTSTGGGTAGTANLWAGNTGTTSDPAGLCRPSR